MPVKRRWSSSTSTEPVRRSHMYRQACCAVSRSVSATSFWPLTISASFRLIMIGSPVALDVMFELFDNELLITDNAFHHVANRNYTNQSFTFEHRKMAHGFRGHHSHAFLDR